MTNSPTNPAGDLVTRLREIIVGIDKTQTDDPAGWWETSTGAEFGASIKLTLEQFVSALAASSAHATGAAMRGEPVYAASAEQFRALLEAVSNMLFGDMERDFAALEAAAEPFIDMDTGEPRAALSSPAPEGEATVTIPYDDFFAAYRYVPRSKMFPDDCLKTRLRALLHEEDLAHADEAEALAAPEGEAAQIPSDSLPVGHYVLEQADMMDGTGRVSQTVSIGREGSPGATEYQRIVHADEAYGVAE